MKKRLMAILMMAMMVVAYMPAFAFAEGEEPSIELSFKTGSEDTTAVLEWEVKNADVGENSSFKVYRDDFNNPIGTTKDYQYTDPGLAYNTTYNYKVDLVDEGGNVIASSEKPYTTPAAPKPPAPANVTGFNSVSSYNAIVLSWKPVAGAEKYIIRWSTAGKSGTITPAATATSHIFGIGTQDIDKAYTFKITAVKNGIESVTPATRTDEAVRTLYYSFKFKKNCKLTSHGGIARKNTPFKKNQQLVANAFQRGQYRFWYNGSYYYTNRIRTKSHGVAQINNKAHYSDAEAESYVNRRGLTSKKNYLVWTNGFTQTLYIFKGSKGNWKVVNKGGWQVSSGKPSSPTANGVTKISRRMKKNHGIAYWSVCNVYSLHGKNKKWTLGYPKSGACVRNTNDHAKWIYFNVPKYSTVVFY